MIHSCSWGLSVCYTPTEVLGENKQKPQLLFIVCGRTNADTQHRKELCVHDTNATVSLPPFHFRFLFSSFRDSRQCGLGQLQQLEFSGMCVCVCACEKCTFLNYYGQPKKSLPTEIGEGREKKTLFVRFILRSGPNHTHTSKIIFRAIVRTAVAWRTWHLNRMGIVFFAWCKHPMPRLCQPIFEHIFICIEHDVAGNR